MVLAPPPDFNLLLSTDRILKFEPLLKDTKLFGDKDDDSSGNCGKVATKDIKEAEQFTKNFKENANLSESSIDKMNATIEDSRQSTCESLVENKVSIPPENKTLGTGDTRETGNLISKENKCQSTDGDEKLLVSDNKIDKIDNQIPPPVKKDGSADRIRRKISNNLLRIDDTCKLLIGSNINNQDRISEMKSNPQDEKNSKDNHLKIGQSSCQQQQKDDGGKHMALPGAINEVKVNQQEVEKAKYILLKEVDNNVKPMVKPPEIQLSLDSEEILPRKRCSPTMISKDKPIKLNSRYSSSQERLDSRYSSISSRDFKRNSSPEVLSVERTSTGSPKFLSKSMTNLSYRKMLNEDESHQSRKRLSNFFSSRGSIYEGDHNGGSRSESHWPKPRTPSLFRRFSMKTLQNTTEHAQNHINVVVPEVNVTDDSSSSNTNVSSSGKGIFRNLSFRSANRLNLVNEEDADTLIPVKSFPALRSPFSRSKFERDTVEIRKRVYDEMLKSIQDGDCKRLKLLLKRRRTDINTFEHNHSLIHEASYKGCIKCVKALIKSGWSVNLTDEAGWKPVHSAAFGENVEMVKCLLQKDGDPNVVTADGYTALHLAIYNDDLLMTHELIQLGADPLFQTKQKMETPFQWAINLKKNTILDYMLMLSCFFTAVDEKK